VLLLYGGKKIELSLAYENHWANLSADISGMVGDGENASCRSIDGCLQHIVDECFARLGIAASPDVIMGNLAHITPHVLLPSGPTAYMLLLCHRFVDVVGSCGAVYLRSTLVREFLHIAGQPSVVASADLLQELSGGSGDGGGSSGDGSGGSGGSGDGGGSSGRKYHIITIYRYTYVYT
jgi:hypothetical protein